MDSKKRTYIEIDEELLSSIRDYCKLNDLKLTEYINSLLKKNFMIDKYGEAPPFFLKEKKNEEKTEIKAEPVIETKEEEENHPQTNKVKKKIKAY